MTKEKVKTSTEFEMQLLDPVYSSRNCKHNIENMGRVIIVDKLTGVNFELIERKMYCPNCNKFLKNL